MPERAVARAAEANPSPSAKLTAHVKPLLPAEPSPPADEPFRIKRPVPATRAAPPAQPAVRNPLGRIYDQWAGRGRQSTAGRSVRDDVDPIDSVPDVDAPADRPPAGPRRNNVAIDRDMHEVAFRLQFRTAAIGVTALLVVVGLAYIVGKRTGEPTSRSAHAAKPSAQPSALDPRVGKPANRDLENRDLATRDPGSRDPGSRDGVANVQPAAPGGTTSQVTPPPPYEDTPIANTVARRTVGLNYVIIKTYAQDFQDTAIEVSQFLNANGVPNTIEIGSPAISCKTGDFVIAGTRGFTKGFLRSAEYEQYMQAIQTVAARFPQRSKLNKPQPMPVKWPG